MTFYAAIALVAAFGAGFIHHALLLSALGPVALWLPAGIVFAAVAFSTFLPWPVAAASAALGHLLCEAISRRHRLRRAQVRAVAPGLRLVIDNTK